MTSKAQQPEARPASNRQRRPTERENYRIAEQHEAGNRTREKEKKSEKYNKKTLRATYLAHPEYFECEPEELLSDIDRNEEHMFSDRSVPTKVSCLISGSTGKIPPASVRFSPVVPCLSQGSGGHGASSETVTSDDESADGSNLTNVNNKAVAATGKRSLDSTFDDTSTVTVSNSPAVTVTATGKRSLGSTFNDTTVTIDSKAKRKRSKVSDFDHISKEVLTTASSIYRCLIVTRAPFPDNILIETKLAKEAWHEACTIKGVDIDLTSVLVKMLLKRISQVRGELKTKMRLITATFFGFRSSDSKEVVRHNRDLAESLKEGLCFIYQDWVMKRGIYKTELLQSAVNTMWFASRNDEGVIYDKLFNPLPLELLALVLAVVECCIDEWLTGFREDIQFTSATYASVYIVHLESLQRFDEHTNAYKLLDKIRVNLYDTARSHAGAATVKTAFHITDEAFDEAIREYQVELQDCTARGM